MVARPSWAQPLYLLLDLKTFFKRFRNHRKWRKSINIKWLPIHREGINSGSLCHDMSFFHIVFIRVANKSISGEPHFVTNFPNAQLAKLHSVSILILREAVSASLFSADLIYEAIIYKFRASHRCQIVRARYFNLGN